MHLLLIAALFVSTAWGQKPPATRIDNVKDVLHGVEIIDPYRWLEDQNSPETRAWIDSQNAHTRSLLDKIRGRERLRSRLTQLMRVDDMGLPATRGSRYFYARRLAGQDQAVLVLREGRDGRERVLVDPNPLSPDRTTSATLLDVCGDGKVLAYGLRLGGEDEIAVRLLEVDTGRHLPDELPRGRYGVSLRPDASGFYYSKYTNEGTRIFHHTMGEPVAADRQVFGDGYGLEQGISARVSEDGRYLLIHVFYGSALDRTEIHLQDLAAGGPIRPVVNEVHARFLGEMAGDTLFIATDWQAPNRRVMAADLRRPARLGGWREVIPEGRAVINRLAAAGGRLFVDYTENASSRLAVFSPTGRRLQDVRLPAPLGSIGTVEGRWSGREAFFHFNSFHVLRTIFRYEVESGTPDVWWRANVPVDRAGLELKQVWYSSRDGTRVPMFLLHRKGLRLDGSHPALLTGYGGFNVSVMPYFSPQAVLWAENGGVFALPNLRGGGEFGQKWHFAGRRENKQNVFDDFIGAAEWLVKNRYTSPAKLAISGTSNGGLLVGAALTQRPDLFQAVVCRYPLLDMVRFHSFLVARWWVPEYGSADDPEQFRYIHAYSPYHRVKPGTKYPAVLFVTGDGDTRVDPLHARKMTGMLQAATGSERPVLLLYDTKAGHSAGLPVSKRVEDLADELSFLYWQLGVAK